MRLHIEVTYARSKRELARHTAGGMRHWIGIKMLDATGVERAAASDNAVHLIALR